jgi:hypothetical protein
LTRLGGGRDNFAMSLPTVVATDEPNIAAIGAQDNTWQPMERKGAKFEPWYSVHGLAVFAALAVGMAFCAAQPMSHTSLTRDERGMQSGDKRSTTYNYGWPISWLRRIETEQSRLGMIIKGGMFTTITTRTTDYQWEPAWLLINGIVFISLTLSVMFVCERWRRSSWRFSSRSLLALVAVAALVLLGERETDLLSSVVADRSFASVGGLAVCAWATCAALAVSVGCAVFALSWLLFTTLKILWEVERPPQE